MDRESDSFPTSFLDALLFMGTMFSLLLVLVPDNPRPSVVNEMMMRRRCCCPPPLTEKDLKK